VPSLDAIDLARGVLAAFGLPDKTCDCEKCEILRRARAILEDQSVTVSVTAGVSVVKPTDR